MTLNRFAFQIARVPNKMFSSRPPEGYCFGNEATAKLQTAVDDDITDDEVFYPDASSLRPSKHG